MAKATVSHPGVFVEEVRTTVKVIPGVDTRAPSSQSSAKKLLASGYKIIKADIGSSGVSLLLGKGADLVLIRMVEYREGGSVEGQLVVTFVGKVP